MLHHIDTHKKYASDGFKVVSTVAVTWRSNRVQVFKVPGGFRAGLLNGYVYHVRELLADALNDKMYLASIS